MGLERGTELDNWDSRIRRYCFQKLSSLAVDIVVRERAIEVIAFVSADLGISPPAVIWIRPASPAAASHVLGPTACDWADERHQKFARVGNRIPGGYAPWPEELREVWLRSDLSAFPALEYVAAHEVRHVWQKATDITIFRDECRAEGDAYPYGYDVLKRYLAARARLTPEIERDIEMKRESARSEYSRLWPNGRFGALDI
jgi:hypothetical protein